MSKAGDMMVRGSRLDRDRIVSEGREVGVGQVRHLNRRRLAQQALVYVLLIVLGVVFSFPFLWMVSTSLKTETEALQMPPTILPTTIQWGNYAEAATVFPFLRAMGNTMIITLGVLVGSLLSATLVAYGFARMRFPGRDALFLLVLSTMMIPPHVTLIPQYLLFRELRWLDSFLPLIVPKFFGGTPFYIFLLRQFFMTIPLEYDDAARIDGCGTFGIFWRIIVPLARPALGTMAIFVFMHQWNALFVPLIYLNRLELQPLAVALATTVQSLLDVSTGRYVPWVVIMALTTLTTLPPIAVFFFAQRYFIQGVVVTGMKG